MSPKISVSNLQARVTLDGERAYPSNASAPSCMPGQRTWGGVSFPADGDARPRHLGRRNGILLIFIYKDIHVNTLLFIFSVLLPKVEELVEERKLILWGDMVLGGLCCSDAKEGIGFGVTATCKCCSQILLGITWECLQESGSACNACACLKPI